MAAISLAAGSMFSKNAQVVATTETTSGAFYDDAVDGWICIGESDGGADFDGRVAVDGVEVCRPVEGDVGDFGVGGGVVDDGFEGGW